jgi:hypothetical protein
MHAMETAPLEAIADDFDVDAGAGVAHAALALARRFSAGATMWCLSPEWPEHARHLAVEVVHPVVVGKRALPAVAVADDDPVRALRPLARPGDILCVVASSGAEKVAAAMRRAPAWGLTSVWIGAGDRGAVAAADHQLWTAVPAPIAAYDGTLVFRYHVLWELTHVCFEHPGLLMPTAAVDPDGRGSACVTCSDEGRLAEVVHVDPVDAAVVRTGAGIERVDVSLVQPVQPEDLLLVHAGIAIAVVEAGGR